MDLTMWHSKWLCYQWMVSIRSLRPQQPGKDKNRAGSMAMWVAPIRVYNHLSRGSFNFLFYSMLSQSGDGCWSQPLVIYIRYTQAKWVVGHVWLSCKMFLLNSSVSFLEYTDRKVVPYLVIVGNPLPNTCLRFRLYTICRTWDESVSARLISICT